MNEKTAISVAANLAGNSDGASSQRAATKRLSKVITERYAALPSKPRRENKRDLGSNAMKGVPTVIQRDSPLRACRRCVLSINAERITDPPWLCPTIQ